MASLGLVPAKGERGDKAWWKDVWYGSAQAPPRGKSSYKQRGCLLNDPKGDLEDQLWNRFSGLKQCTKNFSRGDNESTHSHLYEHGWEPRKLSMTHRRVQSGPDSESSSDSGSDS